ncbi:MAG: low temperature requirement protein A [Actinomycetota bacterium]
MGNAKRTTRDGWIPRPDTDEDFVANPVELFFDLAFVIAFAQLVSHLVHHPDVEGVLEAALIFWMMWLPWTQFTWAANAVSAHSRQVQVVMLLGTVLSVPMAASVQSALGGSGLLFTGSLSAILALGLFLIVSGHPTGSPEWRAAVNYSWPNVVAMGFFVAGAAFDAQPTRVTVWLIGMAIIAVSTIKAGNGEWVVRAGHFAERHGLILIIALGEVIVAIALPVLNALGEDESLPAETTGALILAGLFAGLLWWSYFDRPQKVFEHRMEELPPGPTARFARDVYTYLHALIVSGVIMVAAALEEITLHPTDELYFEFRMIMLVGLLLFFGAVELGALRAYHVFPPERAAAMVAVGVVLFAGGSIDGIWLLAIIDAIIIVALAAESLRLDRPEDTARDTEAARAEQTAD